MWQKSTCEVGLDQEIVLVVERKGPFDQFLTLLLFFFFFLSLKAGEGVWCPRLEFCIDWYPESTCLGGSLPFGFPVTYVPPLMLHLLLPFSVARFLIVGYRVYFLFSPLTENFPLSVSSFFYVTYTVIMQECLTSSLQCYHEPYLWLMSFTATLSFKLSKTTYLLIYKWWT